MNNPDSEEQRIIDQLLLENALEVVGVNDSNGEFLYAFTDKIKDVMPELYEDHLNFVNAEIMTLWEKGYLDINFLEENPAVKLSTKALDKEEVSKLSTQELWSLEEIKRLLKTPEV